MLDVRNRELAEVTKADDFIVSDKLISLMLSQVSENKHLNGRLHRPVRPRGLGDLSQAGRRTTSSPDRQVNFYTVVEAARRRGEVAIGYRLRADATDAVKAYGVVVNPKKSKTVTFTDKDWLIVLAED